MSDLRQVIDSGMCIGCGACIAADPTLELVLDDATQSFRPSHPSGPAAASVCPAVGVDFAGLEQARFPGRETGPHGVVDSVLLAQSTDVDRNLRASSGGLIKELLRVYLRDPEVDGVISIVHDGGISFSPALITTEDEVDQLPGSIYHALPFDGALRLLADRPGRYVVVAIPCQLEGLFAYVHQQAPALAERIHGTVGLLCGWQYTHHALRAICEFKGVRFEDLVDVSWRGGGPVGRLRLVTPDTEVAVSRRVDFSYQVAFDRSFNIPRCHLCVNHSNFLADIVVGDAWLPSTVFTRTGVSLVICRTEASTETMHALERSGRIVSTTVDVDEITESQGRRVVFGDFAYAYQDFLAEKGLPHPRMEGPNRSAAQLSPRQHAESFHAELTRKLALQRERRYRRLWLRKLTREFPKLARKYFSWFLVRILRVKSLAGKRKEIPRSRLQNFR